MENQSAPEKGPKLVSQEARPRVDLKASDAAPNGIAGDLFQAAVIVEKSMPNLADRLRRFAEVVNNAAKSNARVEGEGVGGAVQESDDLKAAKVVIIDLCSALERHMDKRKFHAKNEDDRAYENACAWLAGAAEFMEGVGGKEGEPSGPSDLREPSALDSAEFNSWWVNLETAMLGQPDEAISWRMAAFIRRIAAAAWVRALQAPRAPEAAPAGGTPSSPALPGSCKSCEGDGSWPDEESGTTICGTCQGTGKAEGPTSSPVTPETPAPAPLAGGDKGRECWVPYVNGRAYIHLASEVKPTPTPGYEWVRMVEAPRGGSLPATLRGDGPCADCGTIENIRWFVDHPTWNAVCRPPGYEMEPILCIPCFAKRAEKAGINPPVWQLAALSGSVPQAPSQQEKKS